MTPSIHSRLAAVIFAIFILFAFQSCSTLSTQSNDDKLAKISGADFVISVPSKTVNLDLVTGVKQQDQSILRLVSPEQYQLAFKSNGNSSGQPLKVEDPSILILNSLNKYFQKKYDLRYIAKGTINNIDPDYLSRALKQGDYVVDVRLSDLTLNSTDGKLFYLQGAFQYSVISQKKAEIIIQDTCAFSDADILKPVSYFSQKQGLAVSQFLKKFTRSCLQYFGQGVAMPAPAKAASAQPVKAPKQHKPTSTGALPPSLSIGVSSGLGYYSPNIGNSVSLYTLAPSLMFEKPFKDNLNLVFKTSAIAYQDSAFPVFGSDTFYGASISVGGAFHSKSNPKRAIAVLVNRRMAQHLEHSLPISTNSWGAEFLAYTPLIGNLMLNAQYSFLSHYGPTTSANTAGHELSVGISLQFLK